MSRIEEALRKAKDAHQKNLVRSVSSKSETQGNMNIRRRKNDISRQTAVSQIPASQIVQADDRKLLEERVIAASDHDKRVGPYRQLRTRLLKTMRDNHWTTLAITSPNEGAGKSLTATNLAIALSKDINTTVLLIDLDFTTPTIHKKLALNAEKGLVDYLNGQAELQEILFDPGFDDLTVLAGRSVDKQSSELLASPKMLDLMQDLCHQSEANVTIFDLPPLLRNDDAILFAPYADATLIVVEDGVTTEDQLQQAILLLDKANVIGTILNKARI